MSTIKVDTIQTRTGSGNITVSNTLVGDTTGTHTGNIATNSITTQSGTDITIPTGKKIVVTDEGGLVAPGSPLQYVSFADKTHRSWSGSGRSTILAVPGTLGDGSVFITRKSNTSKILIDYSICCGMADDAWTSFIVQYAPAGSGYSTLPDQGQAVTGIQNAGCLAHFGASAQGSYGNLYNSHTASFKYLLDPNTSVNKVFVRLTTSYGHNSSSRTCYLNRPDQVSDNNRFTGISTVTLTEIAQ